MGSMNYAKYSPSRKQFARQPDSPDGKSVYLPRGIDLSFFHPEAIAARPPNTVITYLGKQKVNGEEYDVVRKNGHAGDMARELDPRND